MHFMRFQVIYMLQIRVIPQNKVNHSTQSDHRY